MDGRMSIYAELTIYKEIGYGEVRNIVDMGSHDPESPAFIDLTGIDPAPQVGWWYEKATDTFTETLPPEVTVPRRTLTAAELWLGSFTDTERAEVWALCAGEDLPGVTITLENRYRTAAFRDLTLSGLPIPLHADEAVTVISGLESAGLLDPGRADEILEIT